MKNVLLENQYLKVLVILILGILLNPLNARTQAPQIVSTVPANEAVGVTPTGTYLIAFDEPVSKVSFKVIRLMRVGKPDVEVAAMNSFGITTDSNGNFVIEFTSGTIENGEEYYLDIPNTVFKDASDNFFAGTDASNWSFTNNYLPTNITFDNETIVENIVIGSSAGGFSVTDQDVGQTYTYSLVTGTGDDDNSDFSIVNNELIVNEEVDFETKDEYRIRVAVVDDAGGLFEKDIRIEVEDVDDTAPVLLSSLPASNATEVSPYTSEIVLIFDEDIFFSNSKVVTLYLDRTTGAVQTWQIVNGSIPSSLSVAANQITLQVSNELRFGEEYSVRGFFIEDANGNETITSPFSFTTRSKFTENDILSFTAQGIDGSVTIDPVNHTVEANMLGDAPVFVDPVFTFSDGAGLFGSLPDQWATNTRYWESGSTKTVNVRSENASTQTWSVTLTWPPLDGEYSIGSGGYYETFGEAIGDMELRGIANDVSLELMDGHIEVAGVAENIGRYDGSETYTTTITVADGASEAILQSQTILKGTQNVVIDGKGVLQLQLPSGTGIKAFRLIQDVASNVCQNTTIQNISVENGSGLIEIVNGEQTVVKNNTYTSSNINTVITLGLNSSDTEVIGNDIKGSSLSGITFGILIQGSGNASIVNNIVNTDSERGAVVGMFTDGDVTMYHNTLKGDFSGDFQSTAGISGSKAGSLDIQNNIIDLTGVGELNALYLRNAVDLATVTFTANNISLPFTDPEHYYAQLQDESVEFLEEDWEAFLTQFPVNTNENVEYTDESLSDLSLSGSSLNAAAIRGIPLTAVSTDAEGNTRSTAAPSKGALEVPNTVTDIISFSFSGQQGTSIIDDENAIITAYTSASGSLTLAPNLEPFPGASVSPQTGVTQDFSDPVVYTVTAEEGNTADWTVSIFNERAAPTDIMLSNTIIPEDQAVVLLVGQLTTIDADVGETYTYSLVTGEGDDDNASFFISGDELKNTVTFDFETKNTYSVRINTNDGNGGDFEKEFAITISNVSEAPTDITLSSNSIAENEAAGTVVGAFSTTDVDAGETYIYTLVAGTGDADNTSFTIDGDELKSAAMFDFETKDSYSIRVNTNDGNGGDFEKAFTITISDVFEVITWSGTAWSNTTGPTASDDAVINGDYSMDTDGAFEVTNLTINTGFILTVDNGNTLEVDGDLTNNGRLVVTSGSSLITYAANTTSGNAVEIKRNTRYSDGKYSFVGSPVEQNSGTTAADLGSHVYTYDESQSAVETDVSRWIQTTGTDQLEQGRGYTQANQKLIEFGGTPNTGTITYSGTYANDGWHLVSNPYAAAIFIDDFLDANLNTTDAVYIWDDNNSQSGRGSNDDYIVANKTGATDISGSDNEARYNFHIGSAQGFFVKLDGSAGNITFTEGMRRGGNNDDGNFFRKSESKKPIARLNLKSTDGLHKQAIVGWNNDVSDDAISEGYDAAMFNVAADYAIFTEKADTKLTIQTVTASKMEIPLGINVAESGTYLIEVSLENGYDGSLYLYDALTEEPFDLTQGAYSFTTNSGQITERFKLLTALTVLALEGSERSIYTFGKTLFIRNSQAGMQHYQLYNLSGKLILNAQVNGSTQINLSKLPSGIYLVSDGVASKKVILK